MASSSCSMRIGRNAHDQQPRVVGQPVLVVGEALVRFELCECLLVEQMGHHRHVVDVAAPAVQGCQLAVLVVVG
jgi:hypothetical protein